MAQTKMNRTVTRTCTTINGTFFELTGPLAAGGHPAVHADHDEHQQVTGREIPVLVFGRTG